MAINKLPEFAKDGQKNTDDLVLTDGFPVLKKPARQWFNYLFNMLSLKINEIIESDPVTRSEIVDNLTTNDATKPLSAKQGKDLQDNKLGKTDLKDASTTQKGVVQLNNTLTSTSTTQALTAAQGKVLNDQAFGVGVDYYDVTSLRVKGTIYTATGSKPRQLCIDVESSGSSNTDVFFVRKNDLSAWMPIGQRGNGSRTIFPIILPGYQYKYESPTNFTKWIEVY